MVEDYHKEVQVWEGQEVTLKLKVSGFPRPTVEWLQDNAPVEADCITLVGKDGSVTFICVDMSQGGTYHFVAKNVVGKVEGDVKLIVESESDETNIDRVDSVPVKLEKFGEHVSGQHASNNRGFILHFHVSWQ